ncbi:hypothetical protein BKA62DRAFT_834836 [Auriculariales sp. MPI-PUGE-AT-0066]|nr:hypothetical protein BKA62DRAFT_834836 [Auriculariales sp. MPI-PUGE-AT-0066]
MAGPSSRVVLPSSNEWQLSGSVKLTTRREILSFCPLTAGTSAEDPILLSFEQLGHIVSFPTLSFHGAAVIVYGAVIGNATGHYFGDIDDGSYRQDVPLEQVNAAKTAACDIVLFSVNTGTDSGPVHTTYVQPGTGNEIAIFNVTVLDQPLPSSAPPAQPTSTPGSSSSTATPRSSDSGSVSGSGSSTLSSSTTTASDSSSSTHDREVTRASSSTFSTSVESDTAVVSLGTVPSPRGKAIPITAIVVPVVVILLLAFLAVLWWWLRRSRRLRQPVQPYAPPEPPSSTQPTALIPEKRAHRIIGEKAATASDAPWPVARPSTSDISDPQSRAQEKMRRLNTKRASLYESSQSMSPSISATSQVTPTSNVPLLGGASSSSGSSSRATPAPGANDPVQMQALSEAMQRAGFSAQALLESLNRVHAHADPEIESSVQYTGTGQGRTARTMPPQYQA